MPDESPFDDLVRQTEVNRVVISTLIAERILEIDLDPGSYWIGILVGNLSAASPQIAEQYISENRDDINEMLQHIRDKYVDERSKADPDAQG